MQKPEVVSFFDPDTNTGTHIAIDPETKQCAIIDSVLDYDPASGRTSTASADKVIEEVQKRGLTVQWILETHAHADHLSAAPYLKQQLGGETVIGENIQIVQGVFTEIFNLKDQNGLDGSEFDRLMSEGELFHVGNIEAHAFHTPGHTPACMAWVIGDAVFVGDTLFMPDYGTARCDFPGGDAHTLYQSVQKLFELPDETRVYLCHDYLPKEGRTEYQLQTTIGDQKRNNIHIHEGVTEEEFVKMRTERDATLDLPRLILPSVQVNIRAGDMPPAEDNGTSYIKIPINKV